MSIDVTEFVETFDLQIIGRPSILVAILFILDAMRFVFKMETKIIACIIYDYCGVMSGIASRALLALHRNKLMYYAITTS